MKTYIISLSLFSLILIFSCQQESKSTTNQSNSENPIPEPTPLTFQIIKTLAHDTSAFTQGFIFDKGQLIEGTGLEKHTRINKIDTSSAKG